VQLADTTVPWVDLAERFVAAAPDPTLTRQRIGVALYELLAEGEPVGADPLAERAGVPIGEVVEALDRWPNVFRDDDGHVIAFGGLALRPTDHAFEVDGRTLHTWCAWDTLFIPSILGRPGRVTSRSPVSGEPITLTVTPDGVHDVSPATAALSLVNPGEFRDLIRTFCHHVHFFSSPEEGRRWAAGRDDAHIVSPAEGFELGRVWVEHNYGRALAETARAR
jgi:alkylmercury lyase